VLRTVLVPALAIAATTAALTVAGGVSAAAPPPAMLIYAAPDGSGPACSVAVPCSITGAQAKVRELELDFNRDIHVVLADGTYRLTAPLRLDARDSGTNGHDVVWTAAPGAHPVISGGTRITGWQQSDASKDIWAAPAPAGLQTRQLYVNGVRAQRAAGVLPTKLTKTDTGYTADSAVMASWRNPSDVEFVYTGGAPYWSLKSGGEGAWTEPRCPVASIDGTTITMAQPCWDNSTKRIQRTDGSGRSYNLVHNGNLGNGSIPAYIDNAYELLDQPGEWYLDRATNTVYYIPRPGEDLANADVEAPVLQQLVVGAGTESAPVHNIVFSGVQFAYATWLRPSTGDGFNEIQANYTLTGPHGYDQQGLCQFVDGGTCPYGAWTKEPGNVSFSYDSNIQFLDDAFVHLGAAGLDLGDGSQHDTVRGSVFTDISGNGLEIGGVDIPAPTSDAQHTADVQVSDNHLYGLPAEYHGGVAIDVGYAEHTLITHNQIDHTPYTAISLGWGGWPDKISVSATPNYSNNNVVSHNVIDHAMQMLADGGGIYTQGITGSSLADGEHLIGNVITNTLDNGHALYCDNGCTFWTASDNVLVNNISNDWGARHTDYRPGATGQDPLTVSDNYWWQGDGDSSSKNTTVSNNHVIASVADAPASIVDAAGIEPAYRGMLGEQFGTGVPDAPDQLAAFGANGAAYVGLNPVFVDHGSPVTSYTVTASPGGQSSTISASDLERLGYVKVDGLANGTGYTFTATATNAFGTSAPSLPTSTITPTAFATSSSSLSWPDVPSGQPDNVTAGGQTIEAGSASGATLGFLLTGTHGPASGSGTIAYTDGSTQPFTLNAPDWYSTAPSGSNIAFSMTYRNRPGNVQQTHQVNVFYAGIDLDQNKQVASVTLPDVSTPTSSGPAIHVFAMTIGSTSLDLSSAYDNVGITDDTATDVGNIDGSGSSLSAQALADVGITPGSTVESSAPTPGAPTSVSAKVGDGAVSLHFTPPSSPGITPILGYTITSPELPAPVQVTGHDFLWAGSGDGVYTVIGGLTNGTTYQFKITANNVAGAGRPASVTATPSAG
jgi:hypothetical protein